MSDSGSSAPKVLVLHGYVAHRATRRGYVAAHDIDLSFQVQSKRQHLWQTRGFFAYIHAIN